MPGVRAVGHGPRIGLDVKANGTERRQMAKKKKKNCARTQTAPSNNGDVIKAVRRQWSRRIKKKIKGEMQVAPFTAPISSRWVANDRLVGG